MAGVTIDPYTLRRRRIGHARTNGDAGGHFGDLVGDMKPVARQGVAGVSRSSRYASYRRACVQLNKAGYRFREPDEPPRENPRLLRQSLNLASQVRPVESIAGQLGPSSAELSILAGLMASGDPVVQAAPIPAVRSSPRFP